MKKINQVVILAGGRGTRMREKTETLPKPMVRIGNKPVLLHLIEIFQHFQNFEFIVCTGYKSEIIQNYFKNFKNVKTIYTGLNTNTGGRLYRIKNFLEENFLFTYGDGLANVNIKNLINNHFKKNKIGTITVANPRSRFGLVEFDKNLLVKKFTEKPTLEGYVNIGFMVFNREIVNELNKNSILETTPLINLVNKRELSVNIHKDFFEPMDTYRDYIELNRLWKNGNAPWKIL